MSDSVRPQRRQPTRLPRPWDSPGRNTGAGCHFLLQCMKVKRESEVAQSCPTLSDPMDCSPPGSSINGIFQARVLEWGAITSSLLETRSPQLNCQQVGFLLRSLLWACRWLSSQRGVLSLCIWVLISSYRRTRVAGVGPACMTGCYCSYLFEGPFST